jgi:hypothetical protein
MGFIQPAPDASGLPRAEILPPLSVTHAFYGAVYPSVSQCDLYGFLPAHACFGVINGVENEVDTPRLVMIQFQPFIPSAIVVKIQFGIPAHILSHSHLKRYTNCTFFGG